MSTLPAPIQNGGYLDIKEKLAQLQNHLLESHPLIPSLLRTIHTQLKADPEIVTLLEEEEIHICVQGLEHVTKIKIIEATKPKKKSLKSLDLDDF